MALDFCNWCNISLYSFAHLDKDFGVERQEEIDARTKLDEAKFAVNLRFVTSVDVSHDTSSHSTSHLTHHDDRASIALDDDG